MRTRPRTRRPYVSNFILISVGFGLIYWLIECVIQVYIVYEGRATLELLTRGSFWDRLVARLSTPTANEMCVRLLMLIAFVIFGAFVQHTVRLRLRAESKLEWLNRGLEQRVEERTTQLAAANRDLEAFNYTVSHDLRAPLRGILELSHGLLEAPPSPGVREQISDIQQSAERMERLIDDLLAFSRSGRRELHVGNVNMGELARAVFEELVAAEQGRKVMLDVRETPPAAGDIAMLREAMMNLLSNALKFTRPKEDAHIEVGGREEEGGVQVTYYVKDDGVGFAPEHVEAVFEVFRRAHSDEEFEGTGVGLATVRRIVERHGGRVWAEGEVGRGATFYFSLPAPRA